MYLNVQSTLSETVIPYDAAVDRHKTYVVTANSLLPVVSAGVGPTVSALTQVHLGKYHCI